MGVWINNLPTPDETEAFESQNCQPWTRVPQSGELTHSLPLSDQIHYIRVG